MGKRGKYNIKKINPTWFTKDHQFSKYPKTEQHKRKLSDAAKKYYETPGARERTSISTKEGMKNIPYEKLAYWKGKKNPEHGKWATEHMRGEKNSNWKGGISFEPYCPKFNMKLKEQIRDKFSRMCFLCKKTEEENGCRLSVHHVNYRKDCLCGDIKCELVPLCISCHIKTNRNRGYWESLILQKLGALQ